MAKHTIKLVEQKELNDQHVSFCYRCCDDPSTDSWHTVDLSVENIEEVLGGVKAGIAQKHDHKVNFRKGTHPILQEATKDHEVTF